ncbi:unnamed protein product [Polarella glacialis]|uniref:Methyltransferase type 11 domain-containing protein n=1 Tax=Polarella glacialis TaxID=89957 RepID=A0A813DXL0_POLGL|nr:unnamed protein product [Polarella glacialis]
MAPDARKPAARRAPVLSLSLSLSAAGLWLLPLARTHLAPLQLRAPWRVQASPCRNAGKAGISRAASPDVGCSASSTPECVRAAAVRRRAAAPDATADESDEPEEPDLRRSNLLRGTVCGLLVTGVAAQVGIRTAAAAPNPATEASQWLLSKQMVGMGDYEKLVDSRKELLFQEALLGVQPGARVVEVGVGAGVNFRHLKAAGVGKVLAVEPNPFFTPLAQQAAEQSGLELELRQGVMEGLPFQDGAVDVLVATLVLCSVQDVAAAVAEARRVLRPGGRYIFTEHVAATGGSWLRVAQSLADPLQQTLACGCHLCREPLSVIQDSFGAEKVTSSHWDLNAGSRAAGPLGLAPHFLLAPHISGYAEKRSL